MTDAETETTWDFSSKAVSGALVGERMLEAKP